jgi:hypothetical protein
VFGATEAVMLALEGLYGLAVLKFEKKQSSRNPSHHLLGVWIAIKRK